MKAIVEIPMKCTYKYELNKENSRLILDRVLNQPCPFNYGFIKDGKICEDGDPLDVFIISEHPIAPLAEVKIKPFAILLCTDNGVSDDKVLAYIEGDKYFDPDCIGTIKSYLKTYKSGFHVIDIQPYTGIENYEVK
jgi:inorganic pyrophosphatase